LANFKGNIYQKNIHRQNGPTLYYIAFTQKIWGLNRDRFWSQDTSPFIGELRCQSIQTEHGPYLADRTQKAVYIVSCLCARALYTVPNLL
jgi:hypothetical protein